MNRSLLLLLSLVFSLLISINLSHAQDQAQPDAFSYMDVFELQMVASPQISPDGNTVIYERHQFDAMSDRRYVNLWSIGFNGDNHIGLTSGIGSYGNVVWSPGGDRIAYTSSEEGSTQIFIRWMDEGITTSITNLDSSPGSLAWSPDGNHLLFTKRIDAPKPNIGSFPGPPEGADWAPPAQVIDHVMYRSDGSGYVDLTYSHIFVISADGGAPRQLTTGPYNHSSPEWAPDGQSIIFTADRTGNAALDPNNQQIFEIDVESGELTQITDSRGPRSNPSISPDGQHIAYTGYEDEFLGYQLTELYVINRDGTDRRTISSKLEVDVSDHTWAEDSESLFFRFDDEGNSKLGNVKLNGDYTTLVSDLNAPSIGRPYGGGSYSVADNGRYAVARGSADRPAELTVGHFPSRMALQSITELNGEFFKSTAIGETTEFWVDSSVDDFRIQGWIITPPNFDPEEDYPMILEIHGGPHTNYGPRFTPEFQLMASQGYVVVYTNPRGSTSYSPEFAGYINHNYPSEDYNDLMDAVDYVLDQGYVDDDHLYITGGSGGGVLTAWSIGMTDRFRAAVVAKPVINWYSFTLTADAYPFFAKYWFTEMPWDDPMQYMERSPISLVGNVTTPTMVLVGSEDYRTPNSESEQYYQALKLQDVDASLVKITGASHGIVARPSNLIRKVGYITGWFEKYSE